MGLVMVVGVGADVQGSTMNQRYLAFIKYISQGKMNLQLKSPSDSCGT